MAYIQNIQRPRQENIFDNYGLNMDYTGVNLGSQGMSPSDMPPINYPFSQQSSTRDGYANMFGQNPPKSPFNTDFGAGKFDPVQASQVYTPPPTPQTSDPNSLDAIIAAINRVYTPETTSRDRYNRLLDDMPERNDPGWGRKLVAGGMGLRAKDPKDSLATMEGVMYAPYIRDMAEFKEKTGPFQQAAQLENTANINERTLAGNVVAGQARANEQASRERMAEEKNKIARTVAQARALKAMDYEITIDGDTVYARAPGSKIREPIGSSGGMDKADEIALRGRYQVEAQRVQGESAAGRATQAGAETFVDERGVPVRPPVNPRDPSQAPPEGKIFRPPTLPGPEKAPSLSDRIKIEQDKLKDLYEVAPDAKRYIDILPGGKYQMKKRPVLKEAGWIGKGVTQDQIDRWDELKKESDPSYVPPPSGKSGEGLGTKEVPKIYNKIISSRPVAEEDAEFGRALKQSGDTSTGIGVRTIPDEVQPGRSIQLPPPQAGEPQPMIAFSRSRNSYGISYDGGKTWRPFTPKFVGK